MFKNLFNRKRKRYHIFIEDGGTFASGESFSRRECKRIIKAIRKRYAESPGYYITPAYERIEPGKMRFTLV